MARQILVLGGARSGKSRYAESLGSGFAGRRTYIATAGKLDDELRERVKLHRQQRGAHWLTIEEPIDLAGALLSNAHVDRFVLVDCVTIWLSNLLLAGRDASGEAAKLCKTLQGLPGTIVIVSNEVGSGIVPDNAVAREFRDVAGRANQALAAACSEVVLVTAGLPMKLKG